MTVKFKRILPNLIREGEGGAGGLTNYANYAAVYAVKSTVTENPHFFSINYDLPYYGEGSCKGMILDGRISLFDFLPIPLFESSLYATTSLADTGISIDYDADNIPTFTKTSGNSAGSTDVFIVGTTAFDFGQYVEYEIYHEDTSASGDRLWGVGVSLNGVAPVRSTSGDFVASCLYRWSNFWNIFQASLTSGGYTGFGLTGQNAGSPNDKFASGKVVRLAVNMINPYTAASSNQSSFQEEGQAVVRTSGTASSALSPSNTKSVNIGIYMYSYTNQQSVTKLLRIRIKDLPEYTSQPDYPTYP